MHSLVPLLVAAASVCATARPPGPGETLGPRNQLMGPPPPTRNFLTEYYLPRLLMTQYLDYDGNPVMYQQTRDDWLSKEIDRINRMEEEAEAMRPYEKVLSGIDSEEPYLVRMYDKPARIPSGSYSQAADTPYFPIPPPIAYNGPPIRDEIERKKKPIKDTEPDPIDDSSDQRKNFALTPLDKGYFDSVVKHKMPQVSKSVDGHHEGGGRNPIQLQPPRQTRQNPNLGKTKHLVAEHLDQLRSGILHEEPGSTEKPRSIHLLEAASVDPADSLYGIAIIAAVGTALVLTIIGFALGWYTMTKRAKAAADVDYPAYGVTGPTIDMTGDRKLAHSAHMYHYQHQKQQIIAMERNGLEQRNGSISEPESEEDNEEGDYTVYECPGFATTGDMEVKNPLFSEEPTPAAPGKCELVKPQPKD